MSLANKMVYFKEMKKTGARQTLAVGTEEMIKHFTEVIENGWEFSQIWNAADYYVKKYDEDENATVRKIDWIDLSELWNIAKERATNQ